jgi:hypothetical protein
MQVQIMCVGNARKVGERSMRTSRTRGRGGNPPPAVSVACSRVEHASARVR